MTKLHPKSPLFFSKKEIVSFTAKWAVRQSPYDVPLGLEDVLQKLNYLLDSNLKGEEEYLDTFRKPYNFIYELIEKLYKEIPQITQWNETTPDFVDIDAMIINVTNDIKWSNEALLDNLVSGKANK